MPTLDLNEQEWQALTVMLTKQPWELANPILFKMARMARPMPVPAQPRSDGQEPANPPFWMRPAEGEG